MYLSIGNRTYSLSAACRLLKVFIIAETICTDLFNQFLDMTANLYGYNMIYDPFYAMGSFEVAM